MKKPLIDRKFLPIRTPTGTTVVTWLLYKQINPSGTSKGVVVTLFIVWLVLVWTLWFAQSFIYEFKEPIFKENQ